eukprot:447087-Alexandrium_andersonii.AAC.1
MSSTAAANHEFMYQIIPKFHKLDHCIRRACRTRMNAALFWTFGSEDMMRHMAALAGSCLLYTSDAADDM